MCKQLNCLTCHHQPLRSRLGGEGGMDGGTFKRTEVGREQALLRVFQLEVNEVVLLGVHPGFLVSSGNCS